MGPIDLLRDAIVQSGLLVAPVADDGFVHGTARMPAIGIDVTVNVDPEFDDRPDPDAAVLLGRIERLLAVTPEQWARIIDSIAEEIEEAVGDQPVHETTDLRDDLALASTAVFHDAFLLSFVAPKQFPDSWIRVQLDPDFVVDGVIVDDKDDDIEVVEFDSGDDLLDHLSAADDR
ncbi:MULTISPECIES: cytochrome C5 [unclassified Mycolicibacterium]|uniref:cytochrome C5 n=1 Tax=unclassified Mycolicibacterium TaxID=2636767 RepID=UPI0012DF01EA|nr:MULTISPECIES: cytochrome C5 [unclassified Mycolicibacterium]MUL80867.1 cytochrome C5 [Mycolicibacterium sp. CBMA 329]MUL86633.1 cytochrome C5 [Mycolicibacterium sp. CBMA 331]MUM02837.1 cytochrome C5 [Mycolicibacterium sp. CBMA 334]MUM27671.1 cytochrome C5 [Mycolicibacterium sp. CBMA 295]MUM36930.1 cytochrome C5 [Mycolicibacterium sp. CBMA 247]